MQAHVLDPALGASLVQAGAADGLTCNRVNTIMSGYDRAGSKAMETPGAHNRTIADQFSLRLDNTRKGTIPFKDGAVLAPTPALVACFNAEAGDCGSVRLQNMMWFTEQRGEEGGIKPPSAAITKASIQTLLDTIPFNSLQQCITIDGHGTEKKLASCSTKARLYWADEGDELLNVFYHALRLAGLPVADAQWTVETHLGRIGGFYDCDGCDGAGPVYADGMLQGGATMCQFKAKSKCAFRAETMQV